MMELWLGNRFWIIGEIVWEAVADTGRSFGNPDPPRNI